MKPLKILSITPTFNLCGGIESYCMNYYRHFSDNIQMDFITHDCTDPDLRREVKANGDHVYVLPSLYEGLGIVNIEAQACGLPTVVSDRVPGEADMGGSFSKIPLNASHELWAKHIKKISPATEQERLADKHIRRIREHGYNIATEAGKLEEYYQNI